MTLLEQTDEGWLAWCTACGYSHHFDQRWQFDGNQEAPTFHPSMKVTRKYKGEPQCCHSFLKKGIWDYQSDCTHELAGQKVPLEAG